MSEPKNKLFEDPAQTWAVITIQVKQSKQELAEKAPKVVSHHELIFGGKVEHKRKGDGGLDTLRQMAAFMNKRGMVPQPKIQCLADKGLSALSRKPKSIPAETGLTEATE